MKSLFHTLLIGGALGYSAHLTAQTPGNLVPNGDFELYLNCPVGIAGVTPYVQSPRTVLDWFIPTSGSTDYFHTCYGSIGYVGIPNNLFGHQLPKNGNGYLGLLVCDRSSPDLNDPIAELYREYATVQLVEPLVAGQTYCVSMFVSPAELPTYHAYASRHLGAHFSKSFEFQELEPYSVELLPFGPHLQATEVMTDTTRWYLIAGNYTATGGEKWLTIGNFWNEQTTWPELVPLPLSGTLDALARYESYYYLDQVRVTPASTPLPNIIEPQLVDKCAIRLDTLRTTVALEEYRWSTGEETPFALISNAGTYTIEGLWKGCLVRDTVEVNLVGLPEVQIESVALPTCQQGQLTPLNLTCTTPLANYQWSTGDTTQQTLVSEPGIYTLRTQHLCGTLQDTILVPSCAATPLYVPNVFAPESAGENNRFYASGDNLVIDRMQVFDVWGTLVYDEQNPVQGWDGRHQGRLCPPGVYMWVVTWHTYDNPQLQARRGDVTVVR